MTSPSSPTSASMTTHITDHPLYLKSTTLLTSPNPSKPLSPLRHRALLDGKTLLIPLPHTLLLLDPAHIAPANYAAAARLDVRNIPGCRTLSLAQLRDERPTPDLCVTAARLRSRDGDGCEVCVAASARFAVQFAVLADVGLVTAQTPVMGIVDASEDDDVDVDDLEAEAGHVLPSLQCDFLVSDAEAGCARTQEGPVEKPCGVDFGALGVRGLAGVGLAQELKGVRIVEGILRGAGGGGEGEKEEGRRGKDQVEVKVEVEADMNAEEQLGRDLMDKIMKRYKLS